MAYGMLSGHFATKVRMGEQVLLFLAFSLPFFPFFFSLFLSISFLLFASSTFPWCLLFPNVHRRHRCSSMVAPGNHCGARRPSISTSMCAALPILYLLALATEFATSDRKVAKDWYGGHKANSVSSAIHKSSHTHTHNLCVVWWFCA